MSLRVAFRDHGQQLARAGRSRREREAEDALEGRAREDGRLGADREGRGLVRDAALASVLAFAVFAHNHPVEIARCGERGGDSFKETDGADVDVLVELFADG